MGNGSIPVPLEHQSKVARNSARSLGQPVKKSEIDVGNCEMAVSQTHLRVHPKRLTAEFDFTKMCKCVAHEEQARIQEGVGVREVLEPFLGLRPGGAT